jgi:hypothetical protein
MAHFGAITTTGILSSIKAIGHASFLQLDNPLHEYKISLLALMLLQCHGKIISSS